MNSAIQKAWAWLVKAHSEGDGSASIKRVLFSFAVVTTVIYCGIELGMHGLTEQLRGLMSSAIYTTGGAYVGGRIAEATENNK